MEGHCKWFCQKGYGFITGDDKKDYFVHYSNIEMAGRRDLQEAQRVSFEVEEAPKGPQAKSVKPI